ncbi:hypothetical protein FHS83_000347 [Rhizomicrobium palustre]|uniref:Uncharacterized protein n=1 Tax=Rhizomicrobium palustre TaxID=189966 RepID=A0A846MUX4_9PROT|nr:hypothetical protein [Rhizomicrobium palustre]
MAALEAAIRAVLVIRWMAGSGPAMTKKKMARQAMTIRW